MSRSLTRRLADGLGRHMARVMPASRAEWASGMQAEIEAVDDPGAALWFALGCVRVGYARRLRTVSGALTAMRWSIAAAIVLFAVLVLANAQWTLAHGSLDGLAVVFGALGMAFMAAGLALARAGPGSLSVIAAVMLTVNTIAFWAIGRTVFVHADVYRALIVEGYALWTLLLLAGLILAAATRSTRLTSLARARGWDE